jgi:trk/ktr system potassium uptake protein
LSGFRIESCGALNLVESGFVHIVIIGCGRVGSGLATTLLGQGHTVAIVDRSKAAFRRLPADFAGIVVEGSGFDREALAQAQIERADALAAVTSGDNSNILTARIARETYGVERVVARIYDPRRAEIYLRLGIPTVATVTWTVDQVKKWIVQDDLMGTWTDATGVLMLIERPLPARLAGEKLTQIEVAGKIRVVAVTRGGVPRLDTEGLVGQDGDLLHLAVHKDHVELLDGLLQGTVATGAAK